MGNNVYIIRSVLLAVILYVTAVDIPAKVRDSVLLAIPERMYALDIHYRDTSPDWSMIWNYGDEEGYIETHIRRVGGDRMDDIFRYISEMTLSRVSPDGRTEIEKKELTHSGKDVSIRLICRDSLCTLSCGDGTRIEVDRKTAATIFPRSSTELRVRENRPGERVFGYVQVLSAPAPVILYPKSIEAGLQDLYCHFESSTDPVEGFWEYLDCDIDEPSVQLGGFYRFAIAASEDGGYNIILIDGVRKYRSEWPRFRVKGRLKRTVFPNQFDLEWLDGTAREVFREETSATIDANGIMTLSFPLFKSSIRLRRSL